MIIDDRKIKQKEVLRTKDTEGVSGQKGRYLFGSDLGDLSSVSSLAHEDVQQGEHGQCKGTEAEMRLACWRKSRQQRSWNRQI